MVVMVMWQYKGDEQEEGYNDISNSNENDNDNDNDISEGDDKIVAENMQQRLQRKKAWRRKINFFTGKR